MKTKKIIPCLDVLNNRTVKGTNFKNMQDIGDPVALALKYQNDGADEITLLDISASIEDRSNFFPLAQKVAEAINVPLIVGGGISCLEDVDKLFSFGVNKVSINSAAVNNPKLISKISEKYGSDRIVVAIDGKLINGVWKVATKSGSEINELDVINWAKQVEKLGAGEILFTSMDSDGTQIGYPLDIIKILKNSVNIPIIASGGAGCIEHIKQVFDIAGADAALVASIVHYGKTTITEIKNQLNN